MTWPDLGPYRKREAERLRELMALTRWLFSEARITNPEHYTTHYTMKGIEAAFDRPEGTDDLSL